MFALAAQQPQVRKEREAREASAQRTGKLRAKEQRCRDARSEQLKKAFLMMEANARGHQLNGFMERLEQRAGSLQPRFDKRAKVWISVIREDLAGRSPANEILRESLTSLLGRLCRRHGGRAIVSSLNPAAICLHSA